LHVTLTFVLHRTQLFKSILSVYLLNYY